MSGGIGRDLLGDEDAVLAGAADREMLLPMLKGLSERERLVLTLRFVHDMPQSQIAARLGVSPAHVYRLLTQCLERLRGRHVPAWAPSLVDQCVADLPA